MEKYEDFSGWYIVMGYLPKWSHCNGLPVEWKNTRVFQDGHIIMGYLPRWSHCNGLPAQWKNTRGFFFLLKDKIGLEGALFSRWKLEGNEGSEAHLKGNEGSEAHYL